MKWILICMLFFCASMLFSQARHDYKWVLGTYSEEGIIVDFEGSEVDFSLFEKVSEMEMAETNATFCDEAGNLNFYSNGCRVYSSDFSLMENGAGVNPGSIHNQFCDGGYNVLDGMVALPDILDDQFVYLFHVRRGNENPSFSDILYCTKIDLAENGGLGAVFEKNEPLITDSLWAGHMEAVRHANDTDWWVIAKGYYPGQFHRLLLDSMGVTVVGEQDFNLGFPLGGWGGGQSVFSPDGKRYVHYSHREPQLLLYDFDRATGLMSNPLELHVADTMYFGGAAISSNGRFLYISNAIELWQYDLEAADIQASQVLIDTYDGFQSPFAANFWMMALAPDCRIYMATGNGTDRLHVIEHPNEKGVACGFRQHAVQLPSNNFHTIPNNPNYRLGTGFPVCDSTIQLVTGTVRVRPPAQQVRVWPNPASGPVQVELALPLPAGGEWQLYSSMGQLVFSGQLAMGLTEHVFELDGVPPGLYFWEVSSEGRRVGSGKLVLQH